ncbi:MAG: NAD-dependent epimerase/dehydratase family protein [Candidatus Cloacimonetes bacterium]|nr:NAD-dependent epimerase/dehydratase family protein [Candidatus Cloacimonadota bacterium]
MKKIVITGANGFVGSSLVNRLKLDNYVVSGLVRKNCNTDLIKDKKCIHIVDYNNSEQLKKILKDTDILIHAAALTRSRHWSDFQRVNIDLTEKLVDICNNLSIKHFIFISSQAVTGPAIDKNHKKKESEQPDPVTRYGKSKLEAENIIMKKAEIPWTIVRSVSVFGPGDKDFLKLFKLVKNHFVILNGFKHKYYNLIYIEEMVNLIKKTINNKRTFNEIFHLANPRIITNKELVKKIGRVINSKVVIIKIPELILSPIAIIFEFTSKLIKCRFPILNKEKVKDFKENYWIVDSSKSQELLNYEMSNEFENFLSITYQWYKNMRWL